MLYFLLSVPTIIFWVFVYLANTNGSHLEILGMFVFGLLGILSCIVCFVFAVRERKHVGWWVAALISLSPLLAYGYLVYLDSNI